METVKDARQRLRAALEGNQWLRPGMRVSWDGQAPWMRVVVVPEDSVGYAVSEADAYERPHAVELVDLGQFPEVLPDLDDAPTRAGLLEFLRAKTHLADMRFGRTVFHWNVVAGNSLATHTLPGSAGTEAEAVLSALVYAKLFHGG